MYCFSWARITLYIVQSYSKVIGFFLFKCIFDLLIINILKQAFNMTFQMYFVMILWNFIYLWLFVASRRPLKANRVCKTWYQNACNWDSFGSYFNIRDRFVREFKLFLFHGIETKCSKIGKFEISLLRWAESSSNITIHVLRQMSLPCLSVTNGPSSCIDYSDKPPSKARNEATNSGLMYTGCKTLCTAQRSCSAFRGRTAAALMWRLI